MAKSVNEYYSEKMKKLLEMQNKSGQAQLSSPIRAENNEKKQEEQSGGRGYYERFRSDVNNSRKRPAREQEGPTVRGAAAQQRPRPARPAPGRSPLERTVIDDLRDKKPRSHPSYMDRRGEREDPRAQKEQKGAANNGPRSNASAGAEQKKKRITPEQTARDKYEENLRRLDAIRTAKRARLFRKIRDGVVSCVLIAAVFIVMCVVVYRLLFIINDVSAVGSVANTSEELVLASGVHTGDHLFSFSSREVGELMILRCPEVKEVDVERTPPGTIVFNVVEEEPAFYAEFYGEYRLLSPTLRVLDSVTEEDAKALGCIKIKLPDVHNATAGLTPEFSSVRNDSYIYDICVAVLSSELGDRVSAMDISDKYNMTVSVDSKYIIRLGDDESIETKLAIAVEVLKDPMFSGDGKASVDVTDLSETSVIFDDGLKIE